VGAPINAKPRKIHKENPLIALGKPARTFLVETLGSVKSGMRGIRSSVLALILAFQNASSSGEAA
jgi:hypothetical protein